MAMAVSAGGDLCGGGFVGGSDWESLAGGKSLAELFEGLGGGGGGGGGGVGGGGVVFGVIGWAGDDGVLGRGLAGAGDGQSAGRFGFCFEYFVGDILSLPPPRV